MSKLLVPHLWSPYRCVQAVSVVAPELFTIATLTGHAIRAMGPNYSVSTRELQHCQDFHSRSLTLKD